MLNPFLTGFRHIFSEEYSWFTVIELNGSQAFNFWICHLSQVSIWIPFSVWGTSDQKNAPWLVQLIASEERLVSCRWPVLQSIARCATIHRKSQSLPRGRRTNRIPHRIWRFWPIRCPMSRAWLRCIQLVLSVMPVALMVVRLLFRWSTSSSFDVSIRSFKVLPKIILF